MASCRFQHALWRISPFIRELTVDLGSDKTSAMMKEPRNELLKQVAVRTALKHSRKGGTIL
jgi:hypothetical protein